MDLPVTVSVRKLSGESQHENTTLYDVSGGGLRFMTQHVDWYSSGQEIEILVDLPQSGDICARMTAHGRVVRTISADNLMPNKPSVAVILVTPLRFERSN